jgi:hypothetical protein
MNSEAIPSLRTISSCIASSNANKHCVLALGFLGHLSSHHLPIPVQSDNTGRGGMQWGKTETSPSLGVFSLKKILVLDRNMLALSAVAVVLLVQYVVLLRQCGSRRDAVG